MPNPFLLSYVKKKSIVRVYGDTCGSSGEIELILRGTLIQSRDRRNRLVVQSAQ